MLVGSLSASKAIVTLMTGGVAPAKMIVGSLVVSLLSTDNGSSVIISESSYQGLRLKAICPCAMFKGSLIAAMAAWKVVDAASVSSLCC